MLIIRPARESDIEQIYELAGKAPKGLTTLPHDMVKLTAKVMESVKNIQFPPSSPGGESFLFVLDDGGKVIGTSAVFTKVGGFQPFWTYEVKSLINESPALNVKKEVKYLELKEDHNGPSEIGTLFLDQDHRQQHAGRFLSLSRFLFMAQYPNMFEDSVLAELRGTIDKEGSAVFWNAIGAHFFEMPFTQADMMLTEDKSFIADLMPKFPIYVDLLPKEAQLVMGVVAEETRPAIRLLEQEGFEKIPEIDIFEAGPVVCCKTSEIRTVKQSLTGPFAGATEEASDGRLYMVANVKSLTDYCVTVSEVSVNENQISLPQETIEALGLATGDALRISPLRHESKR